MLKMAIKHWPMVMDHDEVDIVYEDEYMIVVNKPEGIATAPRHRHEGGTLYNRVYGYLGTTQYGVHRLDMFTSGVVIYGKTGADAARIACQFQDRSAVKEYLAICLVRRRR